MDRSNIKMGPKKKKGPSQRAREDGRAMGRVTEQLKAARPFAPSFLRRSVAILLYARQEVDEKTQRVKELEEEVKGRVD